jgi:cell division protein FtsL
MLAWNKLSIETMANISAIIEKFLPYIFLAIIVLLFSILIWNIFLQLRLRKLSKKIEDFFSGGKTANLEELLVHQDKAIKALDNDIQELFNISNRINSLAHKGLYKVGMIRFNPFRDVGGDQSFAIALLNGKNNGLTISSLYTREGTRIYCKNIIDGQSEKHPLTDEEKKAIKTAIGS